MLAESWGEFHLPLGLQIREFWAKSWNIDPRFLQLFGGEEGGEHSCLKYPELWDFPHRKGH